MSEVLVLTRPDGKEVNVVKDHMVEWYASDEHKGTHVLLITGFAREVVESPDEVTRRYQDAQTSSPV